MKQNTILPTLIQKLLFDDSFQINRLKALLGYGDIARKCTAKVTALYLISAALHEWKSFRHCADAGVGVGLPKVERSTLSKKASHLDFHVVKELFHQTVKQCNRVARRSIKIPNQLLLVDSTTVTVGKTRLPWALYHGERSGIKLHVGFTPETGMPLNVVETTGLKHDGPIGEQLTDKRYVLVSDRAYCKISRIDQFVSDKQDFVIRIKDNVELSTVRALQRQTRNGSRVTRDITCRLGTPQSRSEKRHRVVFFEDDHGREIRVVTSLMSISAEEVAEMYKARWAIESFFRWIKQNLNVPVLFGTTPNAVFNQLYAALIAYILLKWLFDQTKKRRIFRPMCFVSFQHQLLQGNLPLDWQSELVDFLYDYQNNRISLYNYG